MPGLQGNRSAKVLWIGLLLFGLALILRILFLQSLPEAAGPHNPFYSGDTPTWLDYASAIQESASGAVTSSDTMPVTPSSYLTRLVCTSYILTVLTVT